jgi:hypothetical protein
MLSDHQIDARLGAAAYRLSAEQREEFRRLVRAYEAIQVARRRDPADRTEDDAAAWTAAFEHVTGTLDVEARGRAYRDSQRAAYAGAVIAAVAGMSELEASRRSTIPRMTLRKALGK